jgi:hypothetical protein
MKLVLMLVVLACAACSSSSDSSSSSSSGSSSGSSGSSSGSSGASSGLPTTGSAAVFSNLVAGTGAACSKAGPALNLGGVGSSGPVVASGSSDNGHAVTVACRVAPKSPAGFDMQASVVVDGVGSLNLSSALDGAGNSAAASLTLTTGAGTWSSQACKLDPTAIGAGAGVSAGRYWAAITCKAATSSAADACDVSGAIRIENCVAQ